MRSSALLSSLRGFAWLRFAGLPQEPWPIGPLAEFNSLRISHVAPAAEQRTTFYFNAMACAAPRRQRLVFARQQGPTVAKLKSRWTYGARCC